MPARQSEALPKSGGWKFIVEIGQRLPRPGDFAMNQSLTGSLECLPSTEDGLIHTFDAISVKLFHSLYSMLGNYEDAQDAMQVAFLRCWQARGSLCGLRNIRAWIWRVSLNAGRDLRDRIRIRRSQPLGDDDVVACSQAKSPADVLVSREQQERLQAALVHLRPEENEVFLLRQNESLTFEEIAKRRGTPVSTGKTLMRSAVRKLRRALHDCPSDHGKIWPTKRQCPNGTGRGQI